MFEFLDRFKYLFARAKHLKELEEENTALKESMVNSINLVTNYKLAMMDMQKFINEVQKNQLRQLLGEDETSELDELEEEGEDYYKLLRKKQTYH
jgi:hypothetical protein